MRKPLPLHSLHVTHDMTLILCLRMRKSWQGIYISCTSASAGRKARKNLIIYQVAGKVHCLDGFSAAVDVSFESGVVSLLDNRWYVAQYVLRSRALSLSDAMIPRRDGRTPSSRSVDPAAPGPHGI